MYTALVQAFMIPGPQNMSAVTDVLDQSKTLYTVSPDLPANQSRTRLLTLLYPGHYSSWKFPGESRFAALA